MKAQKLYSALTPYVVIGTLALTLTSINANAVGHKHQHRYLEIRSGSVEEQDFQHVKIRKKLRRLAKKLDLSQEQRDKVKAIFIERNTTHQKWADTLAEFKTQVDSMLQSSEFDESEFDQVYSAYQTNFKQMAMEKAKVRHAIFQVLTVEQQQKFLTMSKHR
jgi:periplasmic protein CpxP/Spy